MWQYLALYLELVLLCIGIFHPFVRSICIAIAFCNFSYHIGLRPAVLHGNKRYHQPLCQYPSCNYGMGSNGNLKNEQKHNDFIIPVKPNPFHYEIDCLVQDFSDSIANEQELLQSCTKPSKYEFIVYFDCGISRHFTGFVCITNHEKQTVQIQINIDGSYKIIWIYQLVIWVRTGMRYLMFLLM